MNILDNQQIISVLLLHLYLETEVELLLLYWIFSNDLNILNAHKNY